MRRKDREITGRENIEPILRACKTCRVAMIADGAPYVVPLNFGYTWDDDGLTLYFHSGLKGKKIDALRADPRVCFELDTEQGVTGEGDTNIKLDGDNALKSDIYRSGIYGSGSGSLTISGGENDSLTAQGGSGANGISSSGSLTISGGTVTANGDDGGRGISSNGGVTISGGSTVTANGESGTISGGDGIWSGGGVTISGGSTVTANGGNGGSLVGGDGIRSGGGLTVSDGTVTAKGGNGDSKDGYGGDGIRSGGVVTISGNTVNAAGGYGGKVGGYGICSFDRVAISGGTVEAAGGNGSTGGGSGIYSSVIDLSGSLELTAKAGSPTGKALLQNGRELDLDTIKDKLGPGAKVTATDANGKTKQVSIPRPVEPEESSSSSDGGSAFWRRAGAERECGGTGGF